jgi:tyrosine-protein phosphatase SIW14
MIGVMTPKRTGAAATAVVAILAALALVMTFKPLIRDNVIPKNFGVVEEGKLYRAAQMSPAAFQHIIERYNIRTVIDLGAHERGTRGDRLNQRIADTAGITRYRFDCLDGYSRGNPNAYAQTLRIIMDPANHPVLVHCGAGSERTGCTIILYNNITRGTSFEEGLERAQDHKHRPRRNPHLRTTVETYGQLILDSFRTGQPIPGVEPLAEPVPLPPAPASSAAKR